MDGKEKFGALCLQQQHLPLYLVPVRVVVLHHGSVYSLSRH